jgi:hypothetical protein
LEYQSGTPKNIELSHPAILKYWVGKTLKMPFPTVWRLQISNQIKMWSWKNSGKSNLTPPKGNVLAMALFMQNIPLPMFS